jgi:hypothetical protein
VGFLDVARSPDLFEQEAVREYFAGMLDERGEQTIFEGREMDFLTAYKHPSRFQINQQSVDAEAPSFRARLAAHTGLVPQGDTQTRQQLAYPKGLAEIIICPAV